MRRVVLSNGDVTCSVCYRKLENLEQYLVTDNPEPLTRLCFNCAPEPEHYKPGRAQPAKAEPKVGEAPELEIDKRRTNRWDDLEELYCKQRLTKTQIAKLKCVALTAVIWALKRYKIVRSD